MRHLAVRLHREAESRRHLLLHAGEGRGPGHPVVRGVHLHGIELLGVMGEHVPLRQVLRIEEAAPVWIAEPRGADVNRHELSLPAIPV